jgi:hypothetical protein
MKFKCLCLVLGITLALSLLAAGCGPKAAQQSAGNPSGGQVQVNQGSGGVTYKNNQETVQVGGTYQWPQAMPADIPQFTWGKITSVTSPSDPNAAVTVEFSNVTPDAFGKYKDALTQAGWTIDPNSTSQSDSGFLISASKGVRMIICSLNAGDQGLSGMVNYYPKGS